MMKIGSISLDTTWYPGEDMYTDGDIEDVMLDFARTVPPQERNRQIAEKKSWPILYHFSHIRGNILRWVPFQGNEKVLEIGAGCGAITETLCELAGEVTALDLSLKRSQINAWRCQGAENLNILVGNFEDIEPHLPRDYDVITLIGVFEYGKGYIHSEKPYEDFLKKVLSHLVPGGRVLVAIENRFGLKYWAGCTEDHTGRLFDGLEGYPGGGMARTFTKREWEELLEAVGGVYAQWYYPWPDYKFPTSIFSDRHLPKCGEVGSGEHNFDRLRMGLFRESAVYDSILKNGLYPWFANSYFLILTKEPRREAVVYSRLSNERAPRFWTRTDILEGQQGDESRLEVRKYALSRDAEHLHSLREKTELLEKQLAGTGLRPNRLLAAEGDCVTFEYLTGVSLEERLDELVDRGDLEGAAARLLEYGQRLRELLSREDFRVTEGFRRVFVEPSFPEKSGKLSASAVCDIDLLAHNLLCWEDGTVDVLDPEWTFDFPIPADYVVWRFLHYYLEGDSKRHPLKQRGLYARAGLSEEYLGTWEEMERNFQAYILGEHIPMRSMYADISPGSVDMCAYFERLQGAAALRVLQVFYDRGEDFREEDSVRLPLREGTMRIFVPEGARRLRLDPGETPGGLLIRRLAWSSGQDARWSTNGYLLGENRYYYGAGDPQLILEEVPEGEEELLLEIFSLPDQECQEEFWRVFSGRQRELERELDRARETISQMENTKAWKLYRKLRPV